METRTRVLVTGGAGFLGRHVVEALAADGRHLRVLDVATPAAQRDLAQHLEGSVCDAGLVAKAVNGVDAIVHAAFASPYDTASAMRAVNVDGTRLLYDAARHAGVQRFVLVSSTIVEKRPRRHAFFPTAGLSRLDDYRVSRLEAETWLLAQRDMPVAAVRPKTFLGPGKVGAFALTFDTIRRGEPVPILGSGNSRYQLLDIRDMAQGIRLLTDADATGVFQFGAAEFSTMSQDLEALCHHARTGARLMHVPAPLAKAMLRTIELSGVMPLSEWHVCSANSLDSVVDISRAQRELGWMPTRSNARALAEAYDAYVQAYTASGRVDTTHAVPVAHRLLRRVFRALAS